MEDPRPDFTLALHLWNDKPLGWLGITPGPAMAASETFRVVITGSGGHGASPHLSIDPVLASAQIITALQGIVSRNVPPLKSAVISVTSVHGGQAFNVIPSTAELQGTIRTYEPEIRQLVLERFRQVVEGVARSFGCEVEIELKKVTPAVINDPGITARVHSIAEQLLPEDFIDANERTMGSEDMAYLMEEVPGCYFFVGSSNAEKGLNAAHHHPKFDFDESALPKAAGLMASVIADFIRE
jgi:amidohydrolase